MLLEYFHRKIIIPLIFNLNLTAYKFCIITKNQFKKLIRNENENQNYFAASCSNGTTKF